MSERGFSFGNLGQICGYNRLSHPFVVINLHLFGPSTPLAAMSVSQETQKFATRAQGFFKKAVEACMEGKLSKLQQLVLEFVRDNPNCSVEEILTDFNSEGRKIIHLACSSNSS